MKERFKKLWENKTVRILLVSAVALLLLVLCWTVFGRSRQAQTTSAYQPTAQEARLAAILSRIEGAGNVQAMIATEEDAAVSAIIFFDGPDAILTRLRLTQAAAASLNLAENRILVYPAEQ